MELLPAIDLMNGQVVRLERGEAARKTIYSDEPVVWARKWEAAGGDWLHIVDLDAAFGGVSCNLEVVRAICAAVSIPCELGGGMRDEAAICAAFDAGVSRVILGTRACQSVDFIREMAQKFGEDRLAIGIDSRDGKVAIKGWTETSQRSAAELAIEARAAGAKTIIATDIATDGMFTGPNYAYLESLATQVDCNLIASGGVSSIDDLARLSTTPGVSGAIIGKALYDGHISAEDLLEFSQKK